MPDILNNTNIKGNLDVTGALTLGTPLAVAEGGTGANNASDARTNLGMTGDFLPQYLLLAGRVGGQTAQGGTSAAADKLVLMGNSHGTDINLGDASVTTVLVATGTEGVNFDRTGVGGYPRLSFGAAATPNLSVNGLRFSGGASYATGHIENAAGWDVLLPNISELKSSPAAGQPSWSVRQYVAANVAFTIHAAAAQTGNLLDFKNSGGTVLSYINAAGNFGVRMGATAATAYLHIAAGTATASTAPLKLTSGANLTIPENGAFEYDGTNLFFTRAGAVRENVLVGLSGAAAPATTAGAVIVNFYGSSATNFLGDPNSWASVNIGGTIFKIPMYT